ncbi:MAG: response regulator [Anaerolineales bacterium]|nr:response regulator [Anaerolineales bacterium]MCW5855941.1 response regulator [Anaerolineales bacterium]
MARVLVVEDMPDSAEIAAQILRNYAHEVCLAQSAHEGLELVAQFSPELILYDYWLPDMDARTFLSRLGAQNASAGIRVVACTAAPRAVIEQGLQGQQFHAYIFKPYRLSAFMQVVEEQLSLV